MYIYMYIIIIILVLLIIQDINNYESVLLVDRYKYLDLLPCTSSELKTMGYFKVRVHFGIFKCL